MSHNVIDPQDFLNDYSDDLMVLSQKELADMLADAELLGRRDTIMHLQENLDGSIKDLPEHISARMDVNRLDRNLVGAMNRAQRVGTEVVEMLQHMQKGLGD